MEEHGDLQRQILQKTLEEVADEEINGVDPCVICLDAITEPCVGIPCHHANFDYLCLLSWLEQRPNCPLCKASVNAVQYDLSGPGGPKTYKVPPPNATNAAPRPALARQNQARRQQSIRHRAFPTRSAGSQDGWLSVRRNVYRNQLYSLRVGSNRLSRYTEVTPDDFNRDEALVSRARKWIRRELQVFSFLQPEPKDAPAQPRDPVARTGQQRLEQRRANNAEFLLEYIVAILRTVDIKGSAGQAEDLLRDFLGRENARLFLHELLAWLRSPYASLDDWDRHVQYPPSSDGPGNSQNLDGRSSRRRPARSGPARARSASPPREPDRSLFDRVSRPQATQPDRRSWRDPKQSQNRRADWPNENRHLLDRYIPD